MARMTSMELIRIPASAMPVATMTDPAILGPAIGESFRKLDPRADGRATRSCSWSRSSPR